MKILFVHPYPGGEAPSQRFRFEQYFRFLDEKNVSYTCAPFWDDAGWAVLYSKGNVLHKMWALFRGLYHRYRLFRRLDTYDFVFIHREIDPLGLAVFRRMLKKRKERARIIFDLDDAIWIPNSSKNNRFMERFRNWDQAPALASLAGRISGGNDYLCEWASAYGGETTVIPTSIDTENLHNRTRDQDTERVTIGWTGTHSTLFYLEQYLPVWRRVLQENKGTELAVICDTEPLFLEEGMRWIPWNKSREIEDLLQFHIGLMPLAEDAWAKGKCGFKALQYMALGIPALVSPVGVNTKIVDDGINGFICSTDAEWEENIGKLLHDRALRIRMGSATRQKIEEHYSVNAIRGRWLSLFGL